MPGFFVTLGKGAYALVQADTAYELACEIDRHTRTSPDRFIALQRPDGALIQIDASQVVLIQPPAPAQDRTFGKSPLSTPAEKRESITPVLEPSNH